MNEVATPTNKSQYYTNGETVKRCNWCNVEVTDFEISVIAKQPLAPNTWESGLENDAEITYTTLINTTWMSGITGASNDKYRRTLDLGNHVCTNETELCIYVKPVGTITANRYFLSSYTYEIE